MNKLFIFYSNHISIFLICYRVCVCIDASELPFPLTAEISCDSLRLVKVRGVILDSKGYPTHHLIGHSKTISCCLLAGTQSVNRSGHITPGTSDTGRRNSHSNSYTTGVPSGTRSHSPTDIFMEDLPVTLNCENLYDWSQCKPHHRVGNAVHISDNKFAVTVPGEYSKCVCVLVTL